MPKAKKAVLKRPKITAHVPLPESVYGQYRDRADALNMPASTYMGLILIQNLRTPLKLEGGLRSVV